MVKLVIAAIILFVGIAARFSLRAKGKNGPAALATVLSALLCVGTVALSCIQTVPTGHTGVVTTFGRVENTTLDSGVHFVLPSLYQERMGINLPEKPGVEIRGRGCAEVDDVEIATVGGTAVAVG